MLSNELFLAILSDLGCIYLFGLLIFGWIFAFALSQDSSWLPAELEEHHDILAPTVGLVFWPVVVLVLVSILLYFLGKGICIMLAYAVKKVAQGLVFVLRFIFEVLSQPFIWFFALFD